MNTNKKGILVIICVLISLLSIILSSEKEGYELIALFPIALIIVSIGTKIDYLAKQYIGIRILYFTILLKYALFPLLLCFSKSITGIGYNPDSKSIRVAIILQVIELFVISFTVNYFGSKLDKQGYKQVFKVLPYVETNAQSYFIEIVVIVICFLLILIHPDLIHNFSFFQFDETSYTISYFRGLDIRILQIGLMLAFCTITTICRNKYSKHKNKFYYYVALISGIAYMLIFKGDNRASLLLNIICVSIVMISTFPDRKRNSIRLIITIGSISLVLLSIYRMVAVTAWRPQGGTIDVSPEGLASIIQLYLSGPRVLAQGIEAANNYHASLNTLLSDLLIWSGYLGNYISESFNINYVSTTYLFNQYIYGHHLIGSGDQIIPLCAQSYWYFGYIGSWIFSFVISRMLVKFDELIAKSDTLALIYINTMMASVTGMMLGYNLSIIMLYLMDRYLVFYIIVRLASLWNDKMVRR